MLDLIREVGISEQTFYRSKKQYVVWKFRLGVPRPNQHPLSMPWMPAVGYLSKSSFVGVFRTSVVQLQSSTQDSSRTNTERVRCSARTD